MPGRTLIYKQLPWTGGLNLSVDESMISSNQLTRADNIIMAERGSKKSRDGINHNYENSAVVGVSRASSTTTRTIIVNGASFYTGEVVVITGGPASYNGTFTITGVSTTTTQNDTFTYTGTTSVSESTTADTAIRVQLKTGTGNIISAHDFWYGTSSKSQKFVSVNSNRNVSATSGGTRVALEDGGTAWSGTLTTAFQTTFNNLTIITVDGSGNKVKKYSGSGALADLDGSPPAASISGEHLGRLWLNDKTNTDRIHYSPTFDHTKWNGTGDSGAIDIGVGDGDPVGITAIASFRGDLFVWKKTKLYRVIGQYPEEFQVRLISDSLGCVGQNAVAPVDTDDLIWISEKGVHSLAATDTYGDFASSYLSLDIQRFFNESLERSRLKFFSARYLSTINSVVFAFTETSSSNRALTTSSVNNAVWFYNIPFKAWFRWDDLPCQSLVVANDSDKKRLYLGTHAGRLSKAFNGTNYDVSTANAQVALRMKLVTGQLFFDDNPYSVKALKRFIIFYRPTGTHSISASVKIDNQSISPENQLVFAATSSADLLGTTFILGTSVLGYESVFGPSTRMVDGVGRGVKLTIEMNSVQSQVDIQGFGFEFEPAGESAETIIGTAS